MDSAGKLIIGIVTGAFVLAIIAVVLSQKSESAGVIGAFSSGLANIISAAVSPITGNSVAPNIGGSSSSGGILGGLLGSGFNNSPLPLDLGSFGSAF